MTKRQRPLTTKLAFLANYDASRFPRPSVAVDVVLLTVRDDAIRALLGRRDDHPDRGRWALPGSFLRIDESLDAAATRVLKTKAGLRRRLHRAALHVRRARARPADPRDVGRVLRARRSRTLERAVADRRGRKPRLARLDIPWDGETGGPVAALDDDGTPLPLAFDHAEILGTAVKRIRGKLDYAPIGFELLPDAFSLRDLRLVHEAILGRPLNKDSFRRRILDRGLVIPTGERAAGARSSATRAVPVL